MFLNIDKQNLLVEQCLSWKPNIQAYLTSKISNVCQTRLAGLKIAATPAIFYSYWQLDIVKSVLRQKSKVVTDVVRCL